MYKLNALLLKINNGNNTFLKCNKLYKLYIVEPHNFHDFYWKP